MPACSSAFMQLLWSRLELTWYTRMTFTSSSLKYGMSRVQPAELAKGSTSLTSPAGVDWLLP